MSTKMDAGLRVSNNSILVECEENSDYQYKYVVYDDSFKNNPIESVYAIGNIDYNVTDANKLAQIIYEMESRGYGQKVFDKRLRRYAKNYQIILGKYSRKSYRYNQYGTKINQSGTNTKNQPDRTGVSERAKQTGKVNSQSQSIDPVSKKSVDDTIEDNDLRFAVDDEITDDLFSFDGDLFEEDKMERVLR